jgi:hypothetical protein
LVSRAEIRPAQSLSEYEGQNPGHAYVIDLT